MKVKKWGLLCSLNLGPNEDPKLIDLLVGSRKPEFLSPEDIVHEMGSHRRHLTKWQLIRPQEEK